jgi:hypothetical protein
MSNPVYSQSFEGIVTVITDIIETVSGVGTTSFTLSPDGYPANFGGVVSALTDLNSTISGISGGGGGGSANIAAGSGIYITTSGSFDVINAVPASVSGSTLIAAGSGIYITTSGDYEVINSAITSASGTVFSAGSGLYLVNSTEFNIDYSQVFQGSVSGHVLAEGSNTILASGDYITVSGTDVSSIKTYTAGETLAVGEFVCFDAGSLVKASAASGVDPVRYNVFGCAITAGNITDLVRVNSDNIVTLADANITADTQLTPGEPYYLSKFSGQVTRYSTASGGITFAEGYGALVYVGRALSTTQLEVEIQPKIILTE